MKGWKLIFGMMFAAFAALASDNFVNVDVKTIFVPVGFDDNDEIVVVADGYLQSSCLKLTTPLVLPDVQTKKIVVQPRAKKMPGECQWDFRVPFTQVVTLSALPHGSYLITTEDGKVADRLEVKEAKVDSIDEGKYAPVDKVRVRVNEEGKFEAVIEGRFPDSCFRVSEMKVEVTGKTIQLLPLMDRNPGTCPPEETAFTVKKVLPDLSPGRYLLHVRSLNGQSLNDVFNNYWVRDSVGRR